MTDTHPHTVASAARQLGISLRTMQRRIAAGDVDAIRVHTSKGRGYEWRIRLDGDATPDVAAATPDVAAAPLPVASGSGQMTTTTYDKLSTTDTTLLVVLVGELVQERDRLVRENERANRSIFSAPVLVTRPLSSVLMVVCGIPLALANSSWVQPRSARNWRMRAPNPLIAGIPLPSCTTRTTASPATNYSQTK